MLARAHLAALNAVVFGDNQGHNLTINEQLLSLQQHWQIDFGYRIGRNLYPHYILLG